MQLVYICSPLKGDIHGNIKRAKRYCKFAVDNGFIPIAPHIIFTQFLDDDKPSERKLGMDMGLELLSHCNEVWVFGISYSEGMQNEINLAKKLNIKIVFHDAIGNVICP